MAIAADRLRRITADVYERMAESGLLPERGIELIDGLVVTMSPKGERPRRPANCLTAQFVDQRRGRYEVNAGSLSLRLGPHDELEPDIALARVPERSPREGPQPDEIALIVFRSPNAEGYDDGRVAKIGEAISPAEYPDVVIDISRVFG